MRSRFAEDLARRAMTEGVRQILVLGAGLDTFAYRLRAGRGSQRSSSSIIPRPRPTSGGVWRKREIAEPAHLAYVAHDFEQGPMTASLKAAGFDPGKRTFVLWLGVTPYLAAEAVFATLGELAGWPGGAEVVFDYANPPARDRGRRRRGLSPSRWPSGWRRAASPFDAISTPPRCTSASAGSASREIEDLDRAGLVGRYLPDAPVKPRSGPGGHVVRLATGPK